MIGRDPDAWAATLALAALVLLTLVWLHTGTLPVSQDLFAALAAFIVAASARWSMRIKRRPDKLDRVLDLIGKDDGRK